jgi:hypothetical protein
MSRKKFKNRREVAKFYSPKGEELTFGDKLIIKEKKMTPYGMSNVLFAVTLTKDNVQDLINKGFIVQKREEKGWELSEALQFTINKFIKEALDNHKYYHSFVSLLSLIKADMYDTYSNEGCEYGLSLTGKIGKFKAPVAPDYPLFKSPDDVSKAVKLLTPLYKRMYAK